MIKFWTMNRAHKKFSPSFFNAFNKPEVRIWAKEIEAHLQHHWSTQTEKRPNSTLHQPWLRVQNKSFLQSNNKLNQAKQDQETRNKAQENSAEFCKDFSFFSFILLFLFPFLFLFHSIFFFFFSPSIFLILFPLLFSSYQIALYFFLFLLFLFN